MHEHSAKGFECSFEMYVAKLSDAAYLNDHLPTATDLSINARCSTTSVNADEAPAEGLRVALQHFSESFNLCDALWLVAEVFIKYVQPHVLTWYGVKKAVDEASFPSSAALPYGVFRKRVVADLQDVLLKMKDIILQHYLVSPPTSRLVFSEHSAKNRRRRLEDRVTAIPQLSVLYPDKDVDDLSVFCVFDGHGGSECAAYMSTHLVSHICSSAAFPTDLCRAMSDGFVSADRAFLKKCQRENIKSGCTAVCALIADSDVSLAWVGDCAALVVDRFRNSSFLTRPHNVDSITERTRVEDAGGVIISVQGEYRVNGWINVTRSFGDITIKPPLIVDPDTGTFRIGDDHMFLVLGCDGFFDVVSPTKCAELVCTFASNLSDSSGFERIASHLVSYACSEGGSSDNVSVIVVMLHSFDTTVSVLNMVVQ